VVKAETLPACNRLPVPWPRGAQGKRRNQHNIKPKTNGPLRGRARQGSSCAETHQLVAPAFVALIAGARRTASVASPPCTAGVRWRRSSRREPRKQWGPRPAAKKASATVLPFRPAPGSAAASQLRLSPCCHSLADEEMGAAVAAPVLCRSWLPVRRPLRPPCWPCRYRSQWPAASSARGRCGRDRH